MLQPILGGLDKIAQESVPRFLNDAFETGILLFIDHLYKKKALTAPEKKLDLYAESKLAHVPKMT
jgi:hypothetical protein